VTGQIFEFLFLFVVAIEVRSAYVIGLFIIVWVSNLLQYRGLLLWPSPVFKFAKKKLW